MFKQLDSCYFNFIWNKSNPRMRKVYLESSKPTGGLTTGQQIYLNVFIGFLHLKKVWSYLGYHGVTVKPPTFSSLVAVFYL
jgi:hypothetical protein